MERNTKKSPIHNKKNHPKPPDLNCSQNCLNLVPSTQGSLMLKRLPVPALNPSSNYRLHIQDWEVTTEKNPVFQWASCPAILTLAWMLALRSPDAQFFPGRMPPAASTCGPAWHCGGASLGRPLSRSIWGEAAPLPLARRGFGPAGEAGSSSLPRCPGRVSLVASACEKRGGLAPSTEHRAQSNPPPSSQQGTGHRWWRMDQLLHSESLLWITCLKLWPWSKALLCLGLYKLGSVSVGLKRHRGCAVSGMQNNLKGKAVFCFPACSVQNGQTTKNNVKKISNRAAYVYPLWDSLLSY